MRALLPSLSFVLILLFIEFADELIFGAREAAWPVIRSDLNLTYVQIGMLLSIPNVIGNLIESVIGILGDIWKRKVLIVGGGIVYALALLITAFSHGFSLLMLGFVLFYPASGAFVSLSQAALMDSEPERHEQNMARWTFAGSMGIVIGPILMGIVATLGLSWRNLFFAFSALSVIALLLVRRYPLIKFNIDQKKLPDTRIPRDGFTSGVRNAFLALKRKEVVRWLLILEFGNLTLDIFHGYIALYFVDVVGFEVNQAGFAVAIWTGLGLLGDLLLIPLLEKVNGLRYLKTSALAVFVIIPTFLLISNPGLKIIAVGLLGLFNAGWYAIPKGQLYSTMGGQSGTVMTVNNVFNVVGGLIPFGLGMAAQKFGLQNAMWLILLGPLALLIGIPKKSKL